MRAASSPFSVPTNPASSPPSITPKSSSLTVTLMSLSPVFSTLTLSPCARPSIVISVSVSTFAPSVISSTVGLPSSSTLTVAPEPSPSVTVTLPVSLPSLSVNVTSVPSSTATEVPGSTVTALAPVIVVGVSSSSFAGVTVKPLGALVALTLSEPLVTVVSPSANSLSTLTGLSAFVTSISLTSSAASPAVTEAGVVSPVSSSVVSGV